MTRSENRRRHLIRPTPSPGWSPSHVFVQNSVAIHALCDCPVWVTEIGALGSGKTIQPIRILLYDSCWPNHRIHYVWLCFIMKLHFPLGHVPNIITCRPTVLSHLHCTYKFERAFFRHERRTAPTFGTHVSKDTLSLKHLKKFDPPHPRGY